MIDTYNQAGFVRNMETYGLRNMIRALSIMEILNTEEENQRLALAKQKSRGVVPVRKLAQAGLHWVATWFILET